MSVNSFKNDKSIQVWGATTEVWDIGHMTSLESYEVSFKIENLRHVWLITLHYEYTTIQLQLPIQNAVREVQCECECVFYLYTYQTINTIP